VRVRVVSSASVQLSQKREQRGARLCRRGLSHLQGAESAKRETSWREKRREKEEEEERRSQGKRRSPNEEEDWKKTKR
jgi:hypothetical protein